LVFAVNFDQTMLKSTSCVNFWFFWIIFYYFWFFFLFFTHVTSQLCHVSKWFNLVPIFFYFNLVPIFVKMKQYCSYLNWHSI